MQGDTDDLFNPLAFSFIPSFLLSIFRLFIHCIKIDLVSPYHARHGY
jgi:hypothetical protein